MKHESPTYDQLNTVLVKEITSFFFFNKLIYKIKKNTFYKFKKIIMFYLFVEKACGVKLGQNETKDDDDNNK